MTALKPDEITINTGYGPLAVPRSLMALWNSLGWPAEDALKRMAEAGSVDAPPPTPKPRRPTVRAAYMVALDNVRMDDIPKASGILDRMTPAELLLFGEHVDQLRALITERTT